MLGDFGKTRNMQDGLAKLLDVQDDLAKVENTQADFDKDCSILEARTRLAFEQTEMLEKEAEEYVSAMR
jgi:hypothetical protein